MPADILIGSASWTDPTLVACGRFYPPGLASGEARLRYYATQFPLVEVDSSYYGLPTRHNAQLWAERTPPHFVFNVKAFRLFTAHKAQAQALPRDIREALHAAPSDTFALADLSLSLQAQLWHRFIVALEPLRAAGKLGTVHFQFSPALRCNGASMAWAEACVRNLPQHLLSFEFRHSSWFEGEQADRTLDWMRRLGVVHTVVDSPRGFSNCVPCIWEATHPDIALVRLHGRNQGTWQNTRAASSSSRFDYWYAPPELAAMAPEIEHLAGQVRQVHIVFNTNREDQGQANARLMRQLLRR